MTEEQFNSAIKLILSGNKTGLRLIYDAYLPYIYQVILGIVSRKEDAEDITSDFFIKLWQSAGSYKEGNGHKGYLATIARNMALDFLRKQRREVLESFSKDEEDEVPIVEPVSSDNTEEEVTTNIALNEALSTLKEKERVIIDMKVLSDMTFQEIANVLGIPIGTVTWRYQEAIKKLRRCGYYDEA